MVMTVTAAMFRLFRCANEAVLDVERDAARHRILEHGSDSEYDRRLLGDEVDVLKARRKQPPEATPALMGE